MPLTTMMTIDVVSIEHRGQERPSRAKQDDAARVVAPQTILEATKGVPAAPSGYIKECSCLPPLLTSQALLRGNWRSIAEHPARACCQASSAAGGVFGVHLSSSFESRGVVRLSLFLCAALPPAASRSAPFRAGRRGSLGARYWQAGPSILVRAADSAHWEGLHQKTYLSNSPAGASFHWRARAPGERLWPFRRQHFEPRERGVGRTPPTRKRRDQA